MYPLASARPISLARPPRPVQSPRRARRLHAVLGSDRLTKAWARAMDFCGLFLTSRVFWRPGTRFCVRRRPCLSQILMASLSLHDALRRDNNNLDVVRLLFALMVIYGHSFVLTPGPGQGNDLFFQYTGYYAGDLAIKGFFFISGVLLVSASSQAARR